MQIRPGVIAIVFLVSEGLAPGPAGPASHGSELPPPAAPATSPAPAPALAPTFNGLTGYFQAGASEPPQERAGS